MHYYTLMYRDKSNIDSLLIHPHDRLDLSQEQYSITSIDSKGKNRYVSFYQFLSTSISASITRELTNHLLLEIDFHQSKLGFAATQLFSLPHLLLAADLQYIAEHKSSGDTVQILE